MAGWLFLASNCFVGLLLAALVFWLTGYFSLPVRSPAEGWRVGRLMQRAMFGKAQPLSFVKEGQLNHPDEGKTNKASRIILIDQTSVVVLGSPPAEKSGEKGGWRFKRKVKPPQSKSRIRVAGPGLVFVGANESIRGVTSLRNQLRSAEGVKCHTSDNVEFKAALYVTFSVYQPQAVLRLSCIGKKPEDLRILQLDPQTEVVKALSDELDDKDKAEAFVFQRSRGYQTLPSVQLVAERASGGFPPYPLDEAVHDRISSAVYYYSLNVPDKGRGDWTDLPLEEAIRILRNMVSKKTYKELFFPDPVTQVPLIDDYKQRFSQIVRNRGLLSYQLICRLDNTPINIGHQVDEVHYRISPVQDFTTMNILRERGITILSAGFTKL